MNPRAETIVMVCTSASIREPAQVYLQKAGYQVTQCDNLAQARSAVDATTTGEPILLLDWNSLSEAEQRAPDALPARGTRILLDYESSRPLAWWEPVAGVVRKPVSPVDLLQTLQNPPSIAPPDKHQRNQWRYRLALSCQGAVS